MYMDTIAENKQVMRRFLTREEQNKFLAEVEFNWYKKMFYIMFLTGMRIGEVGGLKWSDVDFENKCININRSLSCQYEYGNKVMLLTTPKTHNSYRKIPFFGEAEEMYKSQKKNRINLKKNWVIDFEVVENLKVWFLQPQWEAQF